MSLGIVQSILTDRLMSETKLDKPHFLSSIRFDLPRIVAIVQKPAFSYDTFLTDF